MGVVAFSAGGTLREMVWVMEGVAARETTGTKMMKPPKTMTMHAKAERVFAFLSMALSRAALEQARQSPQRHPGPHTGHEHLAASSCSIFKTDLTFPPAKPDKRVPSHASRRRPPPRAHWKGLTYMLGGPAPPWQRPP